MNAVGWSPYSETSYISPTSIPDAPPKPTFVSGTDTQIVLSFEESPDDNGVPITKYQLEIDSGNNLTSSFHIVTGYSGLVMSYTLDKTTDSLGAPGTVYRVRLAAVNEDAALGQYSEILLIALGSLPSKPNPPTKIVSSSTSTLISIQWSEVTGDTLPIEGYKLYSDSGRADAFTLVFDGSNSPGIRTFSLNNVDAALTYRVRVSAINMNGEGLLSNIAYLTACTTPSGFSAPRIVSVTQTSVQIYWSEPSSNGGCFITGYEIFWAPESGVFSEYSPTNVEGKPFLSVYTLDMSSQTVGGIYSIYVNARNRAGIVSSDTISFILASVPNAPDAATSASDGTYLQLTMSAPANGGSTITSYELQFDFNDGNGFVTIFGGDKANTLTLTYNVNSTLIDKGERYQVRYRAKNRVGWSSWSPISYVLVAGPPSTPPAPVLVSADSGEIVVLVGSVPSDNGSPVTAYNIMIDGGNFSTDVVNTAGTVASGGVNYNITGLTSGTVYRVGVIAVNEAGKSSLSQLGIYEASAFPSPPASLTKVEALSSETSIALSWPKQTAIATPNGYIVVMAIEGSGDFKTVWDGTGLPQTLS